MLPDPHFLADAMLGRLARWLRALGFDTRFDSSLDDPELVTLANAESRILLTRDRHLVTHLQPAQPLLITYDSPIEQLRQVIDACNLEAPRVLFTRCLICNVSLREASGEEVLLQCPHPASLLPEPAMCCPHCRRLYWHGSHTRRMCDTLKKALPGWLQQ
ncbi:hypothetical protein FGL86_03410 [Pistricoccus aurantiacus]|uniref:Mut7-C RNAse domain-containing protein n=1 Tax=Pistricoccus aurantiacus TaxID=1883414 RepID=A0A5B8SPT9_9GAMM|nr:Mut7-C RNAse domain-containing protein [Pistricoccus aurantiacus]QEA38214.1 hypothetical protein FGL86_03410 [Pistricoccus aurantiacus]